MKAINKIKKMIQDRKWKNRYCPSCSNLALLSNYSPCYGCKKGNRYEKIEKIIDL